MKNVISTDKAPAAIGPYSQAIEVNGMVYTSGIIPVVPATGEIPEGSVAQAKQALTNLSHLLEAAGTSMANVVKTTVFIKEMNDFAAINEVYATFFEGAYPARSYARDRSDCYQIIAATGTGIPETAGGDLEHKKTRHTVTSCAASFLFREHLLHDPYTYISILPPSSGFTECSII